MTREELKEQLFRVEAIKIGGLVQVCCTLAATLEDPKTGFALIHKVLASCMSEAGHYEAQLITDTEDGWMDIADFSKDGGPDGEDEGGN